MGYFLSQKIPEENFIKDASDSLKRFRFRKIGKLIRKPNYPENNRCFSKRSILYVSFKIALAFERGTGQSS